MLIITGHCLPGNVWEVDIEGRGTCEDEIRMAYKALSNVVDGLKGKENKEEKANGQ